MWKKRQLISTIYLQQNETLPRSIQKHWNKAINCLLLFCSYVLHSDQILNYFIEWTTLCNDNILSCNTHRINNGTRFSCFLFNGQRKYFSFFYSSVHPVITEWRRKTLYESIIIQAFYSILCVSFCFIPSKDKNS